ncbi:MAG: outer membrane beta-barrel protein [Alphaproteobacteria bacterium]|nr:outer membrane beta-barrel protein [Alphaproteobacteria bacterium]MBR6010439.1 outer membrane beta-barrel protein [Alphaproteobacteria bacterium]
MKSKIMLTSVAALLVSVAGANAMEYRPFVGATMGLQGAVYSNDAKDMERAMHIDMPTDFFVFGIESGVRAGGYNQIYNGGLTLSATKSTYSKVQDKYTDDRVASADMFNISASYDNYIRISGDKASRIDLVLGAGLGMMAYHIDPVGADSSTKWSFAPELKAGMDFELTHNVTLSATARAIIPTRSGYEMDMSYIVGGAVKYIF